MTGSKWLIAAVAVAMLAGSANAAWLEVTTSIAYAFDPVTKEYLASVPDPTVTQAGPVGYWVDFYFTAGGFAAGQTGFGNMSFGTPVTAGLTLDAAQGYYADAATFTWHNTKGSATIAPVWSDNKDGGTVGDMLGILVGINNFGLGKAGEDPRATLGQGTSVYVGSVPVIWDGHTLATMTLFNGVQGSNTPWSVILTTKALVGQTTGMTMVGDGRAAGQTITFGEIPEPATMALLAIGGLLALRRRR